MEIVFFNQCIQYVLHAFTSLNFALGVNIIKPIFPSVQCRLRFQTSNTFRMCSSALDCSMLSKVNCQLFNI